MPPHAGARNAFLQLLPCGQRGLLRLFLVQYGILSAGGHGHHFGNKRVGNFQLLERGLQMAGDGVEVTLLQIEMPVCPTQVAALVIIRPAKGLGQKLLLACLLFVHVDALEVVVHAFVSQNFYVKQIHSRIDRRLATKPCVNAVWIHDGLFRSNAADIQTKAGKDKGSEYEV